MLSVVYANFSKAPEGILQKKLGLGVEHLCLLLVMASDQCGLGPVSLSVWVLVYV